MAHRYSESLGNRKRPRSDTSFMLYSSSQMKSPWTNVDALSCSVETVTPSPIANSQYRFAGGVDTPTQETEAQYERMNCDSESDFRRRWSANKIGEYGQQMIIVGALDRGRSGKRKADQALSSNMLQGSWSTFFASTIGGIAGRVWNFCTAGAFRGFTAGGGAGGAVDGNRVQPFDAFARHDYDVPTPIPGQYPQDEYHELNGSQIDIRPAKRQQISQGEGWVMVEQATGQKQNSVLSSSPYTTKPLYSRSTASRPSARGFPARRPRMPTPRSFTVTQNGSPQTRPEVKRAASFASPHSPVSSPQQRQQRSPATAAIEADLQRYSSRRQREMKDSNDSMKRLNARLQAMIKEGKEALASKVEVQDVFGMDGIGEDEGYVEGMDETHEIHDKMW